MPKFNRMILSTAFIGIIAVVVPSYMYFHPVAVQVIEPIPEAQIQVFGLGTVEAKVKSNVGFKVNGILRELKADHGDVVKKGQVLAVLDNVEQENQVAKALANLEKARANLNIAKANFQKSRINLALKQQQSNRRHMLKQQNAVTVEEVEVSLATTKTAEAEVDLAGAEVAAAAASLRDAEVQVGLSKEVLSQHFLTAPYDAMIISRHAEMGTMLQTGEPAFTLVDPCSVWVRAFVDEAKAGHIEVGQPAEVRLRSLPGQRFVGRVARVDLESDRIGEERRIYVTWGNCPRDFHLGEQAEVVISTDLLNDVVLVPETQISERNGNSGEVWTLENGTLHLRRLSFGQGTLEGSLPVIQGLPEASQVVATPSPSLRQGRRAVILPRSIP